MNPDTRDFQPSTTPGQSVRTLWGTEVGGGRSSRGGGSGRRVPCVDVPPVLVADLMAGPAPIVPSHLTMAAARKIAALKSVGWLLVEAEGRLIGVLDQRALSASRDDDSRLRAHDGAPARPCPHDDGGTRPCAARPEPRRVAAGRGRRVRGWSGVTRGPGKRARRPLRPCDKRHSSSSVGRRGSRHSSGAVAGRRLHVTARGKRKRPARTRRTGRDSRAELAGGASRPAPRTSGCCHRCSPRSPCERRRSGSCR